MFILFVLSSFFAYLSFLNNNPLISAIFLILSLIIISPLLSILYSSWYIYLFVIIFLRGLFIIIVYVTSISSWRYKRVNFSLSFIFFIFIFYPYILFTIDINNISLIIRPYYLGLVLYIVIFLLYLIGFCSYILSAGSAIRKF